jgi:DNA-binding NarL/FixJ family response regulator
VPATDARLRGHIWFPPEVLERYVVFSSAGDKQILRGRGCLSARQAEIAGLLQRRLSDKETAVTLGITQRTVGIHLRTIFSKLGFHDRYRAMEFMQTADRRSDREVLCGIRT